MNRNPRYFFNWCRKAVLFCCVPLFLFGNLGAGVEAVHYPLSTTTTTTTSAPSRSLLSGVVAHGGSSNGSTRDINEPTHSMTTRTGQRPTESASSTSSSTWWRRGRDWFQQSLVQRRRRPRQTSLEYWDLASSTSSSSLTTTISNRMRRKNSRDRSSNSDQGDLQSIPITTSVTYSPDARSKNLAEVNATEDLLHSENAIRQKKSNTSKLNVDSKTENDIDDNERMEEIISIFSPKGELLSKSAPWSGMGRKITGWMSRWGFLQRSPTFYHWGDLNDDDFDVINEQGRTGRSAAVSLWTPAQLQQYSRWAVTGLQAALLLYLARAVWDAVVEVMEEISASEGWTQGTATATAGDPLLFTKREHILAWMDLVEHSIQHLKTQQHQQQQPFWNDQPSTISLRINSSLLSEAMQKKTFVSPRGFPPMQCWSLIQTLFLSGLPLRSNSASGDRPSVESVLSELTRNEAHLLLQCLWTPPHASMSSTKTGTTNSLPAQGGRSKLQDREMDHATRSVWDSISGLDYAKNGLMRALDMIRGRASSTSAYASLFSPSGHDQGGSSSSNVAATTTTSTGVLLYGPPGCGKTMLVKGMAAAASLPCMVLAPSTILRKYVGDTNLQVRSIFSAARKLAPCIVCIDELDGLFRERNDQEHEVTRELKTEFLQLWDGMTSSSSGSTGRPHRPILVVGATNRPFDVDPAVLRRLPQSYYVPMPDRMARYHMLVEWLRDIPIDGSNLSAYEVARCTEGYSPSDLRHLLQTAALMGPIQRVDTASKVYRAVSMNDSESVISSTESTSSFSAAAQLTMADIQHALRQVPATQLSTQYRKSMERYMAGGHSMQLESTRSSSRSTSTVRSGWQHTLDENRHGTSETDNHDGASYQLSHDDDLFSGISRRWETDDGNYYDIGTIEMDGFTFEMVKGLCKTFVFQKDDDDSMRPNSDIDNSIRNELDSDYDDLDEDGDDTNDDDEP